MSETVIVQEMESEIWKAIKGYEGLYEVSNMGRIRTVERIVHYTGAFGEIYSRKVPGIIRKPNIMKGYYCIALINNAKAKVFRIHRLVAEAFIGEQPGPEYQINHIDGNKSNNRYDNLEWVTPKENTIHAIRTGLIKPWDDERKKKAADILLKRWEDEEYRAMQKDNMTRVWSDPVKRKSRTEQITSGIHASKSERYLRNRKDR